MQVAGPDLPSGPPPPPQQGLEVLAHQINADTDIHTPVASLVFENLLPEVYYTFQLWIYLPANFTGKDVSTAFWGRFSERYNRVDMNCRDEWQFISVTAKTDKLKTRMIPCLRARGTGDSVFYTAGWRFSKTEELPGGVAKRRFRHEKRREYVVVTLDDLLERQAGSGPAHDLIRVSQCLTGVDLEIAPVRFGNKNPPDFPCKEYPPGWNPGVIKVPDIDIHMLRDAIVHGGTGLVTVDDLLIRESIKLPSMQEFDIAWTGKGILSLPYGEPLVTTGSGAHIFCGFPGNRNYSHFVMDIISAALVPPLNDAYAQSTPIIGPLLKSYQEDYLSYFPELFGRAIFLKDHVQVQCRELKISRFSFMDAHHFPHPYHIEVMRMLRARMFERHPGITENLPKKIYVGRLDTGARPMLNEKEVVLCVEKLGFTSVTLTGLSVAQQAALFFNATHVIAPHGAGSTNILFCQPGTCYLELLFDNYLQWSMRRINSLVPVVYGCVIGQEVGNESETWRRKWQVDVEQVAAAVEEMLGCDVVGRSG